MNDLGSRRDYFLRKLQFMRETNVLADSGILSRDICIHLLETDSIEAKRGWRYNGSDTQYLVLMKMKPVREAPEPKGFGDFLGYLAVSLIEETVELPSAPRVKIRWDRIEDIVTA
jgi:hypothetical protein